MTLSEDDVASLHQRTEGWPVGLYLAALHLREGGSPGTAAVRFGGDDRLLSEYMESELLTRVSERHRVFLTRTAVLERMSGPLCEAELELPEAAATLTELARSNLLVPLDRRGQWYRHHHLFRDLLLAELERLEPGLTPVLRRRAAGWCLRNDLPEEALEYSIAAGDVDTVARLVQSLWLPTDRQGRITTHRALVAVAGRPGRDRGTPDGRGVASLSAAERGGRPRPSDGPTWSISGSTGTRPGPTTPSPRRGPPCCGPSLCRRGVEQMRADADEAAEGFATRELRGAGAPLTQGLARILAGDLDGGDAFLEDAASPGRKSARTRPSWRRCANGRWWRWHTANGAGPRSWPDKQAR